MALLSGTLECDDGTASEQAFKKKFRIGLQNKFIYTPEIRHYMGTPTTGDRKLDRAMQDNFIEIMATPIACVEYAELGAPIKFRNSAIPNQILNILAQHLKNWDYIEKNYYNVQLPPAEDIDAIHMFCQEIIKYGALNAKRPDGWMLTNSRNLAGNVGNLLRKSNRIHFGSDDDADEKAPMSKEDVRANKVANFRRSFNKMKEGQS